MYKNNLNVPFLLFFFSLIVFSQEHLLRKILDQIVTNEKQLREWKGAQIEKSETLQIG